MSQRRVAVTGLGVVGPCGIGRDAFFAGLLEPQPQGDRLIDDWDPTPYFDNPKEIRRTDRFAQILLGSASEALEQTGELTADPARIGVVIGTGIGGLHTLEDQVIVFHTKGARRVSPFLVPMMMANAGAAAISMRYGFQGPCETTVTACASATHAIGDAADLIRYGRADVVISGGTEAATTVVAKAGFANMTATSKSGYSRPFDVERDGFVQGEGAATLVLEDLAMAMSRGAPILGEILGSANTADAHHITAPAPGGSGAIRCMEVALENAGLSPTDIVHINAHGTGTPLNDAAEAEAVTKVFGEPGPLMTSTKGVTGHALGAAGALEAAAVLLAMEKRLVPPTDGLREIDPELPELDLIVGEPRPWVPGPSLSNSFGFGGHNGTLVIGPAVTG